MLPVKRLDLWLAESDDPVEWLVDNLLHRHGTSVVGGGKGVGKTLFARTLCAAVATGKRLLGRDVRQGGVVYVGREDGKATTKAHFRTLGAANQNIYGMANEGTIHGDHLDLLRGTIEHIRPSLVVIDTLIKFVRIADMTRYENTVYAIEPFDNLARELGCHIMFTTHNRKSGDTGEEGLEILGSVGVQAAADSRLSIIRQAGARWVYGEGRDDAKLEKVQLVKDENGWVDVGITKRASDARELSSRIVDLLDEESEPMARSAIQSRLGVRKETVMSALNALVQDSDVVCIGRGNRTRYASGSRGPLLEVGTEPQTMEV